MMQNNLGNALWRLGERECGPARLEEAVADYALAVYERALHLSPVRLSRCALLH